MGWVRIKILILMERKTICRQGYFISELFKTKQSCKLPLNLSLYGVFFFTDFYIPFLNYTRQMSIKASGKYCFADAFEMLGFLNNFVRNNHEFIIQKICNGIPIFTSGNIFSLYDGDTSHQFHPLHYVSILFLGSTKNYAIHY